MEDSTVKSILSEPFCLALKFSANYCGTSHQCPSPKAIDQNYMKEPRCRVYYWTHAYTPGLRCCPSTWSTRYLGGQWIINATVREIWTAVCNGPGDPSRAATKQQRGVMHSCAVWIHVLCHHKVEKTSYCCCDSRKSDWQWSFVSVACLQL